MGYGEAKQALFELAMEYFAAARQKREELAASPGLVQDILREGARRARAKGAEVLERVRAACGIGPRRK